MGKIVFASGNNIFTVDVNNQELTGLAQLDQEQLCCPRWSPDRQEIAFAIRWGMYHGVYVMNADGTDLKRLAYIRRNDGDRPPLAPVWSEDSQRIDFVYGVYGYVEPSYQGILGIVPLFQLYPFTTILCSPTTDHGLR